ncbi:hypothetical protein JT27_12075 [Alcaligenes faecalis]|nr:hypothetical protein JT27_12075 [Alcaligenes faecalis]
MGRYASSSHFGKLTAYEDGTQRNFIFDDYANVQFAWRYPHLTEHVLYTAQVVTHAVHGGMAEEARSLVIFQRAQEKLKKVLEIPDQDTSRVIRSLIGNS